MGRTLTTDDLKPIRELVELLEASNSDVISIDTGSGAPKKISITNLKKMFLPYTGANSDLNLGEKSAYMDALHLSDTPVSAPTDEGALYMNNGELIYVSDTGAISLKSLIDALDTNKADKDTDAVAGNFAYFDAEGNPVDSGKKDADYEDADTTILKQANIVDALDSTSTTAPLSANQGKVLKDAQDLIKGTGWTDENLADHEGRICLIEQTLDAYGVIYDRDTDSFERTGLAVGMSYTYDTVGSVTTVISDFDDVPIFQWKRCNLADDMTVNAYYGDPTYIEDGSNGQVMVEIPKFYYYAKKDGNTYHYSVADKPLAGFRLHPAFIRDGVIKEHIYIGAFEATGYDGASYFGDGAFDNSLDYLASVAGLQPLSGNTTSFNIVQARTMAQNRGFNWNLKDFLGWSAYQLMQTIEFASFNSQSFLSAGITSLASGTGNHSQNTGHTSGLGNSSGYVNFTVENGATGQTTRNAPSYRGIENPFGNIWEFVDGINITELLVYIADHGFASDTFTDPYKPIGYVGDTSGYMSEHMFSSLSDFGFLPISVVGGGSGSYFCDYYYASTATNRIARVGGGWLDSVHAGAFFWYLTYSSANSVRNLAARLFAY